MRAQYLYEKPIEERRVLEIAALVRESQHVWALDDAASNAEDVTQCTLCLESFEAGETVLKLPWCAMHRAAPCF